MSTARKFIKSWKTQDTVAAEKRKRPITGDFFDIDDPRKRARAEWERDKGTVKGDREYKIRGASDSGSGAGAPLSTHHRREYPNSRDSLPSPSIRDGRQQIINKTATTSRNNRAYPLSPLSRSPEHLSDGVATSAITEDSPERRRLPKNTRPQHSCSVRAELPHSSSPELKQPKALRVDTTKANNNLDLRSPAYTSEMSGELLKDERPKHSFSLGRTQQSFNSYPKSGSTQSRRQSESMAPPVSASIKPARSESSTPKLTTPTTPAATKEISLPTGRSNCSQTPLLDTLNKFAQSIQSSASLTTRRDLLAQQLASQDKDRQRHQRYNGAFTTLVEDTESKLYALGKSSATLEKQVENRSTAQALISSELAEKLQTTEVQVATLNLRADGSETPVNEKVTQTELAIFRTELRKVQEDIANLRRKAIVQSDPEQTVSKTDLAKSLRGYVHQEDVLRLINKDDLDHYMTKYSLDPTEHKADVARLDRKISDIQFVTQQQKQDGQNTIRDCHVPLESKLAGQITEVARLDRKIADILSVTQQRKQDAKEADIRNAKCFGDLTISISRTETKLSDIEQGTGKLKEQYAAVKKGLGHQEESLARLTTLVCGDLSSDKPGLKKLIEDGTQEIAKTQGFVESLRGSIHGLSEAHASTLTTSEQSSAQAVVRPDPSLNQDMVILREELDALKEEQKGKDECVSSDIEKLENLARQQIDKVALLQEEIRRTSVNLYKQPYHSQSLTTSTRPTQPPTPPQSRAFSPQEADRLKLHEVTVALQELKDQTNALETLSAVQQQRFDGLTSDYLVQCMVARMTHIYPNHPSSLPNQVTQIGIQVNQIAQRQSAIDHFLQNSLNPWRIEVDKKLAARPGADVQLSKILDAKVTEVTKALSDTRTCLSSLGTSLTTLQNDFDRQKASDPVSRTLEFANLYSDQIKSLIDRVNVLEAGQNTMTETFTAVMSDITTLNKYLLINSGGTSRQSRSREEVRELGAEPDAEAREPLVTVRDSKSIEIFDDLTDDSNAPSDRLKDRSNVRAQEDSSEEQPHSSRIDYSKDITPSSTRKRKRHSDSLFLENHDSVARLVSVKDQRTLEPWEYA